MRCEKCQGGGYITRAQKTTPDDDGPHTVVAIVCTDCGGTGIAHCCEGMREQPEPEKEDG